VNGLLTLLLVAAAPLPKATLTEDQAVERALKNSPQIRFRSHFVDEAKALTDVGLRWNNPLLRISGVRYDQVVDPAIDQRSYSEHPFYHTSIGIRWSPPELGQRRERRAEGHAREAEANMDLVMARRDTTALVRTLHAQIVSYDAQLALGKDVIEQRAKLRTLVKGRLEQHAATLLDQSLSDVDYLDALTQLTEVEVRRQAANDQLLVQLGLPPGTSISLVPSEKDPCTTPADTATLAEKAKTTNPHLRLYQAQLDYTDAARRKSWLALIPWFDYFQVSYGMAGDKVPSYVAFQLQLTLPILDWKRADRRALFAKHEGLLERIHADERALSDLILRTVAAQAEQAALVKRYKDAASVVEEGLKHIRRALELGQITNLFEVVQLQSRLLNTQRSHMRAQLECKLQQIELERLTSEAQASENPN
jgi:outer membrane protein TolC